MEGVLGQLGGFDPVTQGLLSAAFKGLQMSGPSVGRPVGLGQIIGGAGEAGMGAYTTAQKTMMDEAYRRRLMEMEQVKTEMAKQQLLQSQRKDAMLMGLLGGVPGASGGAPSAPGTPGSPAAGGAPVAVPSASGMPSFLTNPTQALAAQALGLPGAVDLYKHLGTPDKREGGSTYIDRITGQREFMPKLDVGMAPGPNGSIAVAPGAPQAIATLEGAKEGAKAGLDLVDVPQSDGTTKKMPRDEAAALLRGQTPAPAPQPAPAPAKPTAASGWRGGVAEDKANAPARARDAISLMESEVAGWQADLAKESDPVRQKELKDAIAVTTKEIADTRRRFMLPQGPRVGVTQEPGQAAAVRESGQLDAKRADEYRAKLPSIASVQVNLDRLSQLNADDKTYASAGAELKKDLGRIAQAMGIKVNVAETANTELYIARVAELIKDRLASKDYGSGSGVSNLDLIAASQPLPEVAKTREGRQQILDAMKKDVVRSYTDMRAAVDHFDEKKGFSGFRFPSEAVVSAPPAIPKAPSAPTKGAVVNGWRFKGGDPGNRMNWEKAQ